MKRLFAAAVLTGFSLVHAASAQSTSNQPLYVVFFPLWSGAIDAAGEAVINQAAASAKAVPNAKVAVTGYADGTTANSSPQADRLISQLRAQRILDRLAADGIPASRLSLAAAGAQSAAGVRSRRVEINIGN